VTLLQRPGVSSESVRQGLAVIDRQSRAQAELIQDLMDVQRLDSGKLRLETSEVELASVVDAAIDAILPLAAEKDLQISREMSAAIVLGDSTRLQQVFWNLLTNAIKFTPRGGALSVELGPAGPDAEVKISDTGEGIEAEAMPYIFERFRQADTSESRSHGGLGLGLSIVKQIVELHGGLIRVESAGKGQGAAFTVVLPLHAAGDDLRRKTLSEEAALSPISLGGSKVLVVDDELDAREPLRQALEEAGAEVLAVSSVDEVLTVLEQQLPDVIVSDIAMPGRDGYALIQSIRALSRERGGGIPTIALTAYASKEDRERALRAGYDAHLGKPVEASELIEIIASLVAKGSAPLGAADSI
jgi:CheY-like chemotaxis protein